VPAVECFWKCSVKFNCECLESHCVSGTQGFCTCFAQESELGRRQNVSNVVPLPKFYSLLINDIECLGWKRFVLLSALKLFDCKLLIVADSVNSTSYQKWHFEYPMQIIH
jgi:hypothetical protein